MSDGDGGNGVAVALRRGGLADPPAAAGLDRAKYDLIRATVAKDASPTEVGFFLELAARYDLDPFAKEIWCVKGRSSDGGDGKLLIMVGRDGLRKIAQRNGLDPVGDVVRADDTYEVEWIDSEHEARKGEWEANGRAPFHRITHKYNGLGKSRGEIVGAWCRVREFSSGREMGWFEAPIEEYRPTNPNKLKYSPWGSQESAMMLAAPERQALRQATPLSGLLVEGEMDRNLERMEGLAADDPTDPQVIERAVREVVSEEWALKLIPLVLRVNELAPNTWLPSAIQMQFGGQDDEVLARWVGELEGAVTMLEQSAEERAEPIEDADVVPDGEAAADSPSSNEGDEDGPSAEVVERVEVLRARESELEGLAEQAAQGEDGAEALAAYEQELEHVRDQIRANGFTASNDEL